MNRMSTLPLHPGGCPEGKSGTTPTSLTVPVLALPEPPAESSVELLVESAPLELLVPELEDSDAVVMLAPLVNPGCLASPHAAAATRMAGRTWRIDHEASPARARCHPYKGPDFRL